MKGKQKRIVYDIIEDGEVLMNLVFTQNTLHLEHFEKDFENGHSFLFFTPPCPLHKGGDVCWSQWQWITEPDIDEPDDEYGWWIVEGIIGDV